GLEVHVADARRLLKLAKKRGRPADSCSPFAPAPRRARDIDERCEMLAEERIEDAAIAEHAAEILQRHVARALRIDRIAPLDELAALAQHELFVAARKIAASLPERDRFAARTDLSDHLADRRGQLTSLRL